MAHYAKIDNGKVTQIIVVNNEVIEDKEFPESEAIGQAFIESIGLDGDWVQTSYSAKFRGKYAGIGDIWDGKNFIEVPNG